MDSVSISSMPISKIDTFMRSLVLMKVLGRQSFCFSVENDVVYLLWVLALSNSSRRLSGKVVASR